VEQQAVPVKAVAADVQAVVPEKVVHLVLDQAPLVSLPAEVLAADVVEVALVAVAVQIILRQSLATARSITSPEQEISMC
jgi:hypothetical protein